MTRRFSLRERKYAQTKADLLRAVMVALSDRSLDALSVREICESVHVSEATFFNYFPTKRDVICYYLQLWAVQVTWRTRKVLRETGSGLAMVEAVFDETATMVAPYPGVMYELVAQYAHGTAEGTLPHLTAAELALHFPDVDDVQPAEGQDLATLLVEGIGRAVDDGELPRSLDHELVAVLLMNIFFATFVTARQLGIAPERVGDLYRGQLALVWAGIRARSAADGPAI